MTQKQNRCIQRLKNYFVNADAYIYSATMKQAQQDTEFEGMVKAMTVDRIAGKSALKKTKYKFDYRRKDIADYD